MIARRRFLTAAGGGAVMLVAGCTGPDRSLSESPLTTSQPTTPPPTTPPPTTPPPTTPPLTTSPLTTSPVAPAWHGAEFGELDRFLADTATEAFRIVEHGRVVHEWYRSSPTYVRDVASVQKSMLSLLVGRAVGDGLVGLDTRVDEILGTSWTSHRRTDGVSIGHLLTMTSGLDDRRNVVAEPGTTWIYSAAFSVLFDVLTTTTGRSLDELADDWLFGPAGAGTARFRRRPNFPATPVSLVAGAGDLTAIGQLVVGARPGVSGDWLDRSFSSIGPANEAYGLLWWLNGQRSLRLPGGTAERQGALIPNAPPDLVAALGRDDQKLYVSRESGLVVARLGGSATPGVRAALSDFDERLWSLLVELRAG
jgi:CubicO group peptidase (beta-lactamase class C family)